ncbi:cell division protein FtsQ/DivIB [Humibacter ginsengisoli]
MKRPQGFENAAPRRLARGQRAEAPGREVPTAVLDDRGHGTRSAEPDADTAPIPVIPAAKRAPSANKASPASKAASSEQRRGAEPRKRAEQRKGTPQRYSTENRGGSEVRDSPASPSVRAAARQRRKYERAEIKRFTRASRRRRLAWLIGVGSVVLVLLAAALVSLSPAMALRTVRVVGVQRIDAKAVQHALANQLGTPLPLIDYGKVRKELAAFPLIRSYSTEADPPGTLVVRIVERVPIGLLKVPSGYQLVDQAHVVMQTTPDRPGGYPIISIPDDASEQSRQKEFSATANVLAALPAGMLGQVDTASATGAQDVTLKLTSGVSVVWGGPEDAALKSSVLADLLKAVPGASVYDVSAPNSPVTR